MKNYSRVLLHFLHGATQSREKVSTFLFGTRLTNITRELNQRNIKKALKDISNLTIDWGTGTRIGHVIDRFNMQWSRRILTQGAEIILITDGLDSDAGKQLEKPVERLRKSCRRLVWLNPLLRFSGFDPISSGARIIYPHADLVLPVHNINSLANLSNILSKKSQEGKKYAFRR